MHTVAKRTWVSEDSGQQGKAGRSTVHRTAPNIGELGFTRRRTVRVDGFIIHHVFL